MGMFDKVHHQGKTLIEWKNILKGEYSLGELYQMKLAGEDFHELAVN